MNVYKLDVICPICSNKFKGDVLTEYNIKNYRYDFKPVFDEKEDLMKYYIWFCDECHFAGYENKFIYDKNKVEYSDEIIKSVKDLKKEKVSLSYKFFRAGEISKIFNESLNSQLDYYLKSYWISKDNKNDHFEEKSFLEILDISEQILKNKDNYSNEDIFSAYYLLGYLNFERGEYKEAAYYFYDLVKLKFVDAKYKKYIKFALKFLEDYNES